ncbi:pinin/SDK/memA/ protein conserved region-domain-containing protein [Gilbertella persicaria]|uniref:pinin/SDK/memA/ protein conserved region-domain-containing protein n=1 Tax=Gilbertella persicaria TaxID=101096 RepID=UPI002220E570|nr:pinin/SDK/memA/ protein conserved region-domain-containing protein [Gilbertella persicaria]KAI8070573.1 pinin/SDK/memA/ protein conserved region-domain-containing protein [Gilbertella persicaria]
MVQSSIVVHTSQKRPVENPDIDTSEEVKRPRLLDQDEKGKTRNKRLFGALIGTLNKFKDETEKDSHVNQNRQAINNKLHEKLEQERKELQEKLKARKEEKLRLAEQKLEKEKRLLQEKRELSDLLQNEKLAHFLKTSTQPVLYYLPQKLTKDMDQTIQSQKQTVLEERIRFEKRDQQQDGKRSHQNESNKEEKE